jgi:hypothetical protein
MSLCSLPSGKWVGYFMDDRLEAFGRGGNPKNDVTADMKFSADGSTFTAIGNDSVGDFQFESGRVIGDKCSFVKRYATHTIAYAGTITGFHIQGWWTFGRPLRGHLNDEEIAEFRSRAMGTFSMWPEQLEENDLLG